MRTEVPMNAVSALGKKAQERPFAPSTTERTYYKATASEPEIRPSSDTKHALMLDLPASGIVRNKLLLFV